jgi:hypothetical protein
MIECPRECYVAIFGFLELKDLGTVASVCTAFRDLQEQIHSLWTGLFPQIKSLNLAVSAKEKAKVLLTPIHLGSEWENNQCILNLYHKTITKVYGSGHDICMKALSHPHVPNGSFAVYPFMAETCFGVIKSLDGTIKYPICCETDDVIVSQLKENALAVEELRLHELIAPRYHEYKFILGKDLDYSSILTKASNTLRGKAPNVGPADIGNALAPAAQHNHHGALTAILARLAAAMNWLTH